MFDFLSIPPLLVTLLIFILRVTDMSLDTLRVLFVLRGRRSVTWILGFLQSTLWVIAITSVLNNLDNLLNVIAYAGGFATGNVLGMVIEDRLAIGHAHMRVISSRKGSAIIEAIRRLGYAVTEISGRGKDGTVTIISCSIKRSHIAKIQKEISQIDQDAFITVEEIRPIHRGFWRA
ncbi:MAG: hypothetical protein A2Z14_09650 [Chloroflexi bacterium RBG_16_48_8]|nr:MAG: hypothetical protein A2Z14_09650 [Chloroflexi bacterium RBG_16_48_8]